MQREKRAWDRIAVCVNRSTVFITGQDKASEALTSTISINRARVDDMTETDSSVSDPNMSYVVSGVGIVGFLDLKHSKYLGVVTKISIAGNIAGHIIFCVSEVEWIPISFGISSPSKVDSRSLNLLNNLLKSQDFYFSDSLDLTGARKRFHWNYIHARRFRRFSPRWSFQIVHGFFGCLSFSSLGRRFQFALIARRSRYFAGTRYRKRGLNSLGNCANEVEFEQILLSFGPPDNIFSFKQIRGSVPLRWSQDFNGLMGKPDILIKYDDLNLDFTKAHFDYLVKRYGAPIFPVSLLMNKDGSSEKQLNVEFERAVEAIREYHQPEIKSLTKFDLKEASSELREKEDKTTVAGSVMYADGVMLAQKILEETGWTHMIENEIFTRQSGVIRTNCIDCLDRTSIFQFIVGLEVLNRQLISLGVLDPIHPLTPSWSGSLSPCSRDLVGLVEALFEDASDQLALQYAGTGAHKKYSSRRSSREGSIDGGLISSGREILISLSRHYSSTFTDNDKQNAINLFLGLYAGFDGESDNVSAIEGVDKFAHSETGQEAQIGKSDDDSDDERVCGPADFLGSLEFPALRPSEWQEVVLNPANAAAVIDTFQ